jgi:hypothetical protein
MDERHDRYMATLADAKDYNKNQFDSVYDSTSSFTSSRPTLFRATSTKFITRYFRPASPSSTWSCWSYSRSSLSSAPSCIGNLDKMGDATSTSSLVILGVLALFGNTITVVVGAFLTARNARRAQEDAVKAQIATSKAAEALEVTKRNVADSTRELISEARQTNKRVEGVRTTVESSRDITQDTNDVAHSTHKDHQ